MNSPRVWLITEASSGFGKALAEIILRACDIVVATLHTPSVLVPLIMQYPPSQHPDVMSRHISDGLYPVQRIFTLDVSKHAVEDFTELAKEWNTGRICISQPGKSDTNTVDPTDCVLM